MASCRWSYNGETDSFRCCLSLLRSTSLREKQLQSQMPFYDFSHAPECRHLSHQPALLDQELCRQRRYQLVHSLQTMSHFAGGPQSCRKTTHANDPQDLDVRTAQSSRRGFRNTVIHRHHTKLKKKKERVSEWRWSSWRCR